MPHYKIVNDVHKLNEATKKEGASLILHKAVLDVAGELVAELNKSGEIKAFGNQGSVYLQIDDIEKLAEKIIGTLPVIVDRFVEEMEKAG